MPSVVNIKRDKFIMPESVKYILDGISLSVVVTTIAGMLPPIAALMSIIWLGVQLYDRFKKKSDA